jgi:hypothetical protein
MNLVNVNITTTGGSSAPIATDRGGGTITVSGGTLFASGQNSPDLYSTGKLVVSDAQMSTNGSEMAVIEGSNSIVLTNASLSSNKADKWGVMIYQSFSGDAQGSEGEFQMTGGELNYTAVDSPLFYVTNATGSILLKSVNVSAASGILVKASAGSWGNSGTNGGTVNMTADGQTLNGNFVADKISTLNLILKDGSVLNGAFNAEKSAKSAFLTLDVSSKWNVGADSYLTCLKDTAGVSGSSVINIFGNGHSVFYLSSACSGLGGKTYSLAGGGTLQPFS